MLQIVEALMTKLDVEQVATMEQAQLTWAELVVMLKALRDPLIKIDAGEIGRRSVDFAAVGRDPQTCIDAVAAINAA